MFSHSYSEDDSDTQGITEQEIAQTEEAIEKFEKKTVDEPLLESYSDEEDSNFKSSAYSQENRTDDVYEARDPATPPHIILNSDEYTFDPLQNGLPDFAPDLVMIDSDSADTESINNDWIGSGDEQRNKDGQLDTNDISLLLNFGYGEEIKSRVSEDETHRIFNEKYESFHPESHKTPHGFCGKEITDRKQVKQIREKFKSDKSVIIIQLAIISILTITTLLLEGFFEFFSDRSSYLAISAIEMVFVAITVIALNKKLMSGLLGIIRFEANLYSIVAYLLFAYSICNIATSLIYVIDDPSHSSSTLMLFGFCIMLYVVFILVAELLNCIREEETFKMMSRSSVIHTAEVYTAPKDKKHSSKIVSRNDTRSYKLVKASLISGYFQKTSNSVFCNINLIYIIGVVPILSLIAGAISAVISESILHGVYTTMTTTLLCIPFAYVLDPSVIEYVTSVFLKKDNIALIGYNAANEFSKANAICFDDTDAIEIISLTEIHPTKSKDTHKNIDLARKVFEALRGPLGEFSHKNGGAGIGSDNRSDIIINSISENGLAIYFDSSVNILLGDRSYMQAHNIKVKTESNLSTAIKGFDRSVIYMAFDGIPKLGFIITSKVKTEFINIVSLLVKHNVEIFVDTYEPQINDLYFEQSKTDDTSSVSVTKYEKYEHTDCKPVCDGHIICTSDNYSLARAILECKNIVQRRQRHRRTIYAIITLGFVVSCLLMLLMNVSETYTFLGILKAHASTVLNLAMLLALIPGTVSVSKMIKRKAITKKNKEKK